MARYRSVMMSDLRPGEISERYAAQTGAWADERIARDEEPAPRRKTTTRPTALVSGDPWDPARMGPGFFN